MNTISNIDKSKYEELYTMFKQQLDDFYRNKQLDDQAYKICIQMLNDIFNFYINGYPLIPAEYLYKSDDL